MNLQNKSNNSREVTRADTITTVLLVVYLIVLFWILLFKLGVRFSYMRERRVNLIPFRDALFFNGKWDISEIILNIIVFIPLGIYAGILFARWNWRRKLLFFFLTSLLVEGLQLIFAVGAFDTTDILTNTFGGLIGWLLFKMIERAFNNRAKAQKLVNVIAALGTVVVVVLLILLKLDRLPVRYK